MDATGSESMDETIHQEISRNCSKVQQHSNLISSETSKVSSERSSVETDSRDSLSAHNINQKKKLKSTQSEIGEVREENGRLKLVLSKIMKDYQSLQQHLGGINKNGDEQQEKYRKEDDELLQEPDHLVALSLGRSTSSSVVELSKISRLRDHHKVNNIINNNLVEDLEENIKIDEGRLALRLDGRYNDSVLSGNEGGLKKQLSTGKSSNDDDDDKEEVVEVSDHTWPPSKSSKMARSTGEEEETLLQQQHNPTKKARVSVRTICSAPTMNDGCQWRKYGQKIAKGNPCPRAYYRCTVSPSCPVRKHVQRCAEDMSVLITTYEGTHNHPLPPSATAMASTTSAAVSMLKSSSTTSQQPGLSGASATSTSANLHGLNFAAMTNISRHPRAPFYLPNTTISTSQSHPTVTLDLTAPSASSRYNKFASSFFPAPPSSYSSTCLDFSASSSSSSSSLEYWGAFTNKNKNNYLNGSSYINGTSLYQPFHNMPTKNIHDQTTHQPQQRFTEQIAAATKEITSNPSFQSALAAAISSIVGKRGVGVVENNGGENVVSSQSYGFHQSTQNGIGCATSYLNRTSSGVASNNSQQGNLKFSFPPVLPNNFTSNNKGPFVSDPTENGEHGKS